MTYSCNHTRLLNALANRCHKEVDELRKQWHQVQNGLVSVGLKIHFSSDDYHYFSELVSLLGNRMSVFETNYYKHQNASFSFVLPPVGSAETAILLIQCIEKFTQLRIFRNPKVIVQVCSPGRLNPENTALLAIGYYLSSPLIRQYKLGDFATSVADDLRFNRGRRIVIYDADGQFEKNFEWWALRQDPTFTEYFFMWLQGKKALSKTTIFPSLPFSGRSDIFVTSACKEDIQNVNLLASLLIHDQTKEYCFGVLGSLGEEIRQLMKNILSEHDLSHLLNAPWAEPLRNGYGPWSDDAFYTALQELMSLAIEESKRTVAQSDPSYSRYILYVVRDLVDSFRDSVSTIVKGART